MSTPTESTSPTPLPGHTAGQLSRIGSWIMTPMPLAVIPIGFSARMGRYTHAWGLSWLGLSCALLIIGFGFILIAQRKRPLEVEAGYTTFATTYTRNPDLFLLDAAKQVALPPTVAPGSLTDDRTYARIVGDDSFEPDDTRTGIDASRSAVRRAMAARAQGQSYAIPQPTHRGVPPVGLRVISVASALAVGVVLVIGHRTSSPNGHSTPQPPTLSHQAPEQRIEVF